MNSPRPETRATVAALAAARAHQLRAARTRVDRQRRLRLLVWDAVWSRLRDAAGSTGAPTPLQGETPDGLRVTLEVQPMAERPGERPVYALAAAGESGPDRWEAWTLAQRDAEGAFRIRVWVER